MEERKKFGELLKSLRQAAQVSQDGFLNGLAYLLHEAADQPNSPLTDLLARKECEEAATTFSKTDVSKYENGKTKPARSRVLLFIVYFNQKGVINLEAANNLLTYLEYAALNEHERALIFGVVGNEAQATAVAEAAPSIPTAVVAPTKRATIWFINRNPQQWAIGVALAIALLGVAWVAGKLTAPTAAQAWCDDFADGQRDAHLWQPPENFAQIPATPIAGELIYEQDGLLNLRATAAQTQKTGVWAYQAATSLNRPIKEVAFQMTLLADAGNQSSAGADVAVLLADGQEVSLELDLSGVQRRYLYKICAAPPCGAAASYTLLKEVQFPVGVAVPMRIVWAQAQAQVYLDDVLQVEPATQQQPITGVKISLWAHQGGVFHAAVDNLCVQYL